MYVRNFASVSNMVFVRPAKSSKVHVMSWPTGDRQNDTNNIKQVMKMISQKEERDLAMVRMFG